MATGYFIGLGDRTSCGGKVLEGETGMMFSSVPRAYEGHRVSCGNDGESYSISGGIDGFRINGKRAAGTLDSVSTCPCRAKLIPSNTSASYQGQERREAPMERSAARSSDSAPRAAVAPQPYASTPVDVPIAPVSLDFSAQEPGFFVVPRTTTREELIATLFASPTDAVMSKFHSLNPASELIKAGSMIVLTDPRNMHCSREEAMLMAVAASTREALASLTPHEADFLMEHREEIATFLGHASTSIGVGEAMLANHINNLKKTMVDIQALHQRAFQRDGHLRSPMFFAERKQLFARLELHLGPLTRKGVGFSDHPKLKSALGISTRSLVHHWREAGATGQIPGYATHISGVATASKIINAGGWLGFGIGATASYLKVQEVCAAGDAEACEKIKFTEFGSVFGGAAGGMAGAVAAGLVTKGICVGLGWSGAGLIGCAVVVVGGASLAGGLYGQDKGEQLGEIVYRSTR